MEKDVDYVLSKYGVRPVIFSFAKPDEGTMHYFVDPRCLKSLREERGLSQAELARRAKIHSGRRQIQRLENKDQRTSVREATQTMLAHVLGVDPAVLAGEMPVPDQVDPGKRSAVMLPEKTYLHNLIAMDDGFAIVEFQGNDPVGTIIAKGIKDKAAGMRLADAGTMRSLLLRVEPLLDPHLFGWDAHLVELGFNTPEEYERFCAMVTEALHRNSNDEEVTQPPNEKPTEDAAYRKPSGVQGDAP